MLAMVLATTSTGLTAGLLELVVELVEIRRREPLERDSIEAWNDVALEVSHVWTPTLPRWPRPARLVTGSRDGSHSSRRYSANV
jgi:hypothetical protein